MLYYTMLYYTLSLRFCLFSFVVSKSASDPVPGHPQARQRARYPGRQCREGGFGVGCDPELLVQRQGSSRQSESEVRSYAAPKAKPTSGHDNFKKIRGLSVDPE